MFNGKKILALIPARGGSKGIPYKNIYKIDGRELIDFTIVAARESKYVDDCVVSTDDEVIAKVAKRCGANVPFIRPQNLAEDNSKTITSVLHAINYMKSIGENYDVLILLQPTSPLRDASDIDNAIELFFLEGEKGLVSVSEVEDNPILIRRMNENIVSSLISQSSTVRRQDMDKFYKVNGAIYINNIKEISESTSFNDNEVGYMMSKSHAVDIDDYIDLYIAEYYLKGKNIENER